MAEHEYDDLVRDLTALGRAVEAPAPSAALGSAVLDRIPTEVERPAHRRRAALVAGAIAAVLLALLATPPVRAAVADWFGFAGVLVERDSTGSGEDAPPPGAVPPSQSLSEAAALVGFPVSVPEVLGEPDGVEVSADRRLVSMSWTTDEAGVVRLDQFDGRLDYTIAKTAPDVSYAAVNGSDALWFDDPHEVTLLRADGTPVTHSPRLAGHTLIWQDGATTLRLEGDLSLGRAIEIAESAEPVG